jgi:cytidine deaminase
MNHPPHDAADETLLQTAREAATRAYSPYSGWQVGAAIEFEGGRIYPGANVENVSYGLTICAERTAVFAGVVAGERRLVRVAISCNDASGGLVAAVVPCGACLQVLAEFGGGDTEVIIDGGGRFRLHDFLPRPFAAEGPKPGPAS